MIGTLYSAAQWQASSAPGMVLGVVGVAVVVAVEDGEEDEEEASMSGADEQGGLV